MLKLTALVLLIGAGLHTANSSALAMVTDPPRLAVGDLSCTQGGVPCEIRFTGNDNLYPGGPAAQAAVDVAYLSHTQPASVQLYISEFDGSSPRSSPLCTALRPATLFEVLIEGREQQLYAGSLEALARLARTPAEGLLVHAPEGHAHWLPGDREQVTVSIGLDRRADNSYMGCSVQVAFGWLVST